MSGFMAVAFFLVSLFFSFIIFSLWIRMALRYLRVSSLNPFSHLIHTVTNPLIAPINSLTRLKYEPKHRYDWTALGVLIAVEFIKIIILSLLAFHAVIPFLFLCVYVIADLIIQPCDLLFYAILIRVIMSFANPGWQHPFADFLRLVTEPLLRIGRRIVPDISGFDFSPFIMMIVLKVITLFISASLPWPLI